MRKRSKEKVFCIGFHKTGTTSLAVALQILGYRITGPTGVRDPNISENALPLALELVDCYDAFQDNPWPVLFKQIDKRYPDSKFILTIRDSESWIRSMVAHFGRRETPMRKWIYGVGCPEGNEELYVRRYERHNQEVKEYFKGRPDDLLILNVCEGEGWEKLCPFLGVKTVKIPFPHVNKSLDAGKGNTLAEKLVRRSKIWFNRFRIWIS